MEFVRREMAGFSVIGIEGSTEEGAGFFKRLWAQANARFAEVSALAARDEQGNLLGLWGAMSDFSRSLLPWEDGFSKGLYLAGVQARTGAQAPEGWTRWDIPAYECVIADSGAPDAFAQGLAYLCEHGLKLIGAANDFICPKDGKEYIFFPVRKL